MLELLIESPYTAAYLMTGLVSFVSVLLALIGWFMTRTLSKIDENQTKLFDRVHELAIEVAKLKVQSQQRE